MTYLCFGWQFLVSYCISCFRFDGCIVRTTYYHHRCMGVVLFTLIVTRNFFARAQNWKQISPPLRGVIVHILGRPFDQGNEVCPPLIQIREISERKNGEKTRWYEWARVRCSFGIVVAALVHYTRLARVARGRNSSVVDDGILLFTSFSVYGILLKVLYFDIDIYLSLFQYFTVLFYLTLPLFRGQ